MRFDILTIFPELFDAYAKESLLQKAQVKGLIGIYAHNTRDWTNDPHKKVDDSPYGGGLGMVMKIEPIFRAMDALKKTKGNIKSKTILFTPRGEKFTQKMAHAFSKLDRLIMICGRYEGIDERVARHLADKEVSIGDYVLMGGELPAMAVIETVSRLIPGVIGKPAFLKERVAREKGKRASGFVEYPQYTRPAIFEPRKGVRWKVPEVLLGGDHKKIEEWRSKHGKKIGMDGIGK